ncbi:hypothetical protein INH39_13150 [Massilia violaceinigra]|uniref:Uncharacterized protein n=1 Tax=Massilia violaceinigra TaxID=2045208 RepID=A0ABY4ADP9_9BURK|nr:hypothetical protein [Massilia violaceinigra]UOD32512.1 hypothetical protein INH39_13150 [Massilia violaceinigra]
MQIAIKENILEFLGYHGTNEKSARSILTDGVQARFLPPMGQIGRGFYLAKMNGTLPQWGAETATFGARSKLSYFQRMVVYLSGSYNNRFIDDAAKSTILKIYSTQPLRRVQWSIMNEPSLESIGWTEGGSQGHIESGSRWLQMVVPFEELQYLRAVRHDGNLESSNSWLARESHVPASDQAIDRRMGKVVPLTRRHSVG